MQLKDYYKTLEVQPAATMQQIKKSFRQLALRHHPDKNPDNALSEAIFKEIQEAYETLVDPAKREAYNYKRWYNRSIKEQFAPEPLNPAGILNECRRLQQYMNSVNALRVDFDGLSYHLRELLSNRNIGILQQFNDEHINADIVEELLPPVAVLPFRYLPPVAERLLQVAGNNEVLKKKITRFTRQQKQKNNWQQYSAILVVLITLLLCWLIYRVSK